MFAASCRRTNVIFCSRVWQCTIKIPQRRERFFIQSALNFPLGLFSHLLHQVSRWRAKISYFWYFNYMFSIHFFDLNRGYTTNNFLLQWRVFQFWGRNLIFFKSTENFTDKTLHHKYLMSTTDHSNLDWIQFHIRTLHTYKGPNCGRSHIATMDSLPRWPSKFGWSSPKYFLYCQAILNPFSYKTNEILCFHFYIVMLREKGGQESDKERGRAPFPHQYCEICHLWMKLDSAKSQEKPLGLLMD